VQKPEDPHPRRDIVDNDVQCGEKEGQCSPVARHRARIKLAASTSVVEHASRDPPENRVRGISHKLLAVVQDNAFSDE